MENKIDARRAKLEKGGRNVTDFSSETLRHVPMVSSHPFSVVGRLPEAPRRTGWHVHGFAWTWANSPCGSSRPSQEGRLSPCGAKFMGVCGGSHGSAPWKRDERATMPHAKPWTRQPSHPIAMTLFSSAEQLLLCYWFLLKVYFLLSSPRWPLTTARSFTSRHLVTGRHEKKSRRRLQSSKSLNEILDGSLTFLIARRRITHDQAKRLRTPRMISSTTPSAAPNQGQRDSKCSACSNMPMVTTILPFPEN